MEEKGYSLEKCLNLGKKFIQEDKFCLIGFDVKGFTKMEFPRKHLNLKRMVNELNFKFSEVLTEGKFNDPSKISKGFQIYRGDSALAQINSVEGIKELIDYQKENYPTLPLYWKIAKNLDYKSLF